MSFVREHIKPKSHFDQKSFKIVTSNGHKLVVGCVKYAHNAKSKKHKKVLEVQSILHPISEFKQSKTVLSALAIKLNTMKAECSGEALKEINKYLKKIKNIMCDTLDENKKIMCVNPSLRYSKVIEPNNLNSVEPVEIYGRILSIEATKSKNSNFPKLDFRHNFKHKASVFGLPDGSLLITTNDNTPLWKMFKYSEYDVKSYVKEE